LPWYRPNENEAFKTPAPPPPPPPPPRVEHTTITLDLGLTTRVFVEGSVQGATTEFDARFGVKWFGFDVGILGPGGEYVVGVNFFRDAAVAVSHDSQGGQWRILFPYIGLDYLGGSSPSFVRLGAPGAIGVRYTLCKGEQSPLPCAVHADLRVAGVELWMPTQSLQVSTFPVSVTVFTLDVGAFF
jgi:hypothetical protein